MDKIKAFFVGAWALLCEGYHHTISAIERHPAWVFWIVLSYLVIRR